MKKRCLVYFFYLFGFVQRFLDCIFRFLVYFTDRLSNLFVFLWVISIWNISLHFVIVFNIHKMQVINREIINKMLIFVIK